MVLKRQISILLGVLLGAVALAIFAPGAWSQSQPPERAGERVVDRDPGGKPYAAGELIVTYKPNTPAAAERAVANARGAVSKKDLPEIEARVLSFPRVKNERAREARERGLESVKRALERDPRVETVDYNYLRQSTYTPNDYRFSSQYGLIKPGFPQAWDRTRGSSGVRIAIVDNGIATWHTDLRGKVVAQYDFAHNDRVAEDESGHGTHVAGIASAVTGNGQGIAGACPNCTLIAAKFMDATGSGYTSDEVEAIIWAANVGAKVINMSFGGYGWAASEYNAVNYAYNRGAVLVASAGNSGSNALHYPSAHSNVMAVSATDSYDRLISWSNYGSWVDVAAPGRYILSTTPRGYEYWSGTSMSSPDVAGLAGLLAAQGRTNAQIWNRILYTARDLGPAGRDIYYGMGRIDAARAVQ